MLIYGEDVEWSLSSLIKRWDGAKQRGSRCQLKLYACQDFCALANTLQIYHIQKSSTK